MRESKGKYRSKQKRKERSAVPVRQCRNFQWSLVLVAQGYLCQLEIKLTMKTRILKRRARMPPQRSQGASSITLILGHRGRRWSRWARNKQFFAKWHGEGKSRKIPVEFGLHFRFHRRTIVRWHFMYSIYHWSCRCVEHSRTTGEFWREK